MGLSLRHWSVTLESFETGTDWQCKHGLEWSVSLSAYLLKLWRLPR